MSGKPFDFDSEKSDPGDSSESRSAGDNETAKRGGKGCGCIIGLFLILILLLTLLGSCSAGAGAYECGDYDLVDGEYVSAPDRGDYVQDGSDYRYVGCDQSTSSGGGIWFLPFFFGGTGGSGSDGNYGGGSNYRGGGSGTGK